MSDVRLVWHNAYLYNKEGSPVNQMAKECDAEFERRLSALATATPGTPRAPDTGAPESPAVAVPTKATLAIVKKLQQNSNSKAFRQPVDWQALNLTAYPDVIKRPMDLGSLSKNLERGEYATVAQMRADLALIWDNCCLFNGADHQVSCVCERESVQLSGFGRACHARASKSHAAPHSALSLSPAR